MSVAGRRLRESAAVGIRADAISPGFVSSPATDEAVDDTGREYMRGLHLIQRPGTGHDIAALALYRLQPGRAEATADALAAQGHDAWGTTVDLTDPEAARAWVTDGAARLGGIDVLYNNAAGFVFAPFAEMNYDLWKSTLSAELDLVLTRHQRRLAAPDSGRGRRDHQRGSISGMRGIAALGQAAHAAAKGAVIALTKTLARIRRRGHLPGPGRPGPVPRQSR
ncbi:MULTISPECIES: SDR family oxidoreductase [Rhodococcus]|uniref:SDR family oxidoreductase n=1 Tax=Rhodococcus oxybenzonivorans TaxID=1990687 RepID=A0AAE4UVG3_9NOCA|nr:MULTISPECIES: SDR family oxidoreductase [Rhodococcus]MDV7244341.1 SDR family oxidoreductase [Rhodococcus oxybenzonivorans]MDV7263500.1 SDR family oxidoreductase [Rhodococcus oxybenzonivorans]MDV7274416.1 SDR family oxidoreductase [Rhodococcus oxybenzonivorans]MDV7335729.1 SDR family oxidoreductase [Rhodococcus oxybenzonivorans]MDV7345366.1 SDR family oxidoreductase [Rhodococcus oxybenzonivorans]